MIRERLGSPQFYGCVRFAHLFSFMGCVLFFVPSLCAQICRYLLIVSYWFPLRFSLTFIYSNYDNINFRPMINPRSVCQLRDLLLIYSWNTAPFTSINQLINIHVDTFHTCTINHKPYMHFLVLILIVIGN